MELTGGGGMLAVSVSDPHACIADLDRILQRLGFSDVATTRSGSLTVASWGALRIDAADGEVLLLNPLARTRHGDVDPRSLSLTDDQRLSRMLPPFSALQVDGDRATVVTDWLGFRHLYERLQDGWAAVSTSSRALAALAPTSLDLQAVGVGSLMGWQLGDRTLFEGVRKLREGERVTLFDGQLAVDRFHTAQASAEAPLPFDAAVRLAATSLREDVNVYVDEHPDVVVQLSGGLDSRVVLAAVPPSRRRDLTAMTLAESPDADDLLVARELVARTSMRHDVFDFRGIAHLGPAEAHNLVQASAVALEGLADPLAQAALTVAESSAPQGNRLAGVGGEVARGFYYLGPRVPMPVTWPMTRIVADLRLYANESVDSGMLDEQYAKRVRESTTDELHTALVQSGQRWFEATDHFYLYERVQRWAGVTDTAVCLDRRTVNPMLDRGFLDLAMALPPRAKSRARFLSAVICRLDEDLGRIRLDGRHPPEVYADPTGRRRLLSLSTTFHKGTRKLTQRLHRANRPPAGGEILAALVVEHWRTHSDVLDIARKPGVLNDRWIDDVLRGDRMPRPSEVGLVSTLVSAQSVIG
jgi:asparagine synthase (glutamine-hydrolysing)